MVGCSIASSSSEISIISCVGLGWRGGGVYCCIYSLISVEELGELNLCVKSMAVLILTSPNFSIFSLLIPFYCSGSTMTYPEALYTSSMGISIFYY